MLDKKVANYVKNKNKNLSEYKFGLLRVVVKDQIQNDVDLNKVFEEINYLIPDHFLELIDIIYIGEFDFFKERKVNALFVEDALYISNEQDSNEDLKDDIVHEIGHAVEKKYGEFIYGDGKLEDEFLLKRSRLNRILRNQGHDTRDYSFLNVEYDEEFDSFLYEIGYDVLDLLTVNLFLDPYSMTSLREYFATAFENFYLDDNKTSLKKICPYLYKRLIILHENSQ